MTAPNQHVPDQPTPEERFERAVAGLRQLPPTGAVATTISNAQGRTSPVDAAYCARFAVQSHQHGPRRAQQGSVAASVTPQPQRAPLDATDCLYRHSYRLYRHSYSARYAPIAHH